MLPQNRKWYALIAGCLTGLVLLTFLASPTAQSFVIGYFSRIYFGGGGVGTSTGPQIRWGAAAPSGACSFGTLYLQNTAPTTQGATGYFCNASGTWVQIARADQYGNDFLANATTYGAKCDGSTDDSTAIQSAINAAYLFGKAGHVVLPPGTCTYETPLQFGPVTNPFEQPPTGPGFLPNVMVSFTAPRTATIGYTAASTTITYVGGVVTSADIGNYVFYGPLDPEFTAVGEDRVTEPIYGCTITAILTGTSATCVGTTFNWADQPALAPTTGSHASYITDDHHLTVTDATNLTADNLDKTVTFAITVLRAPLDCLSLPCTQRPGSHVALEPYNTPAPCVGGSPLDDWQCFNGGNVKLKYFSATVTEVTDAKHAVIAISGLSPGSNWIANFPADPRGAGSYACNEFAADLPDCGLIGQNPHLDHYIDMTAFTTYLQATTGASTFAAYLQPADTNQRYMSMRGASQAATILNFTGDCADAQWANACAALIFSRNKYFTLEDLSLNNASGSSIDDLTQWGMYFGGLPGVGTQALGFKVDRVGVAGFGVCVQIGDNLGGEASDGDFDLLGVSNCGIGVRIGPGSFNTLDLHFHDIQGGLNKIGLLNYEGNVFIDKGSFSFNDIDFVANGFGVFSACRMRTEGPGIFLVGGEPSTHICNNGMAEPTGTRQITGDVTATPADTHTVAGVDVSNVSVGIPANSFYPITFGSGDITSADLRKTVIIPGLGAAGADVIAQIWTADTATTGTVFSPVAGAIVSAGTVTVTIYDTNLADITFPTDSITTGDIGSALALPDSTVAGNAVRCFVTSVLSTTTGQCGFFLGGQGKGPVITGTSTDPKLFVHDAVYWTSNAGVGATIQNNNFQTGRIFLDLGAVNRQHLTLLDNALLSFSDTPVSYATAGPSGTGKYYRLDIDWADPDLSTLPVPNSSTIITDGVVLPWELVNVVTENYHGVISVTSRGNAGQIYGGPVPWQIPDGDTANLTSTDSRLQTFDYGYNSFDTPLNPFVTHPPTAPVGARQRLSGIKLLSEAPFTAGNNLRILCTFGGASDTVTCPFSRAETIEVRHGVGSPTTFDALTQISGMNVTSGHFSQADVGKPLTFPTCCGDGSASDYWGLIVEIVSGTSITVQALPGTSSFPNGITTGSATVGQDEPDAKWLPAIWGCSGLDLAGKEVVKITSFTASQVVLTSSNATSTAGCLVGVIR